MSEGLLKTSEDGNLRVRLVQDVDAYNPRQDYDHLEHVITIQPSYGRRDFLDIDEDYGPLDYAWARCTEAGSDWSEAVDLFERYCRQTHQAVTYYDSPHDGPPAMWYLMAQDLHEVNNPSEYLSAQAKEYRNWAGGDVWMWVIERSVTWTRKDNEQITRDTWEPVDSLGDLIGYSYAEKDALEAFEAFEENTKP